MHLSQSPPTENDQKEPRFCRVKPRVFASSANFAMSESEAPAKKKSSSKSRMRICSASLAGGPGFCTSSRGERLRSGTAAMPKSVERFSRASASAGVRLGGGGKGEGPEPKGVSGLY